MGENDVTINNKLPNLDDLAENRTELISMSHVLSDEPTDYTGSFEVICGDDIKLKHPLSTVVVVKYNHKGESLRLLFVAPNGSRCNLLPPITEAMRHGRCATEDELTKILHRVDGWLIATVVPGRDDWGPMLCLSVIKKNAWREAGSPHLISTHL